MLTLKRDKTSTLTLKRDKTSTLTLKRHKTSTLTLKRDKTSNTDIKARQDLNADIKERHKTYTLTLMRDTRPSISMSVLLKAEGLQLVPDSVAALQRLGVAVRGAIPPGPGGRAPQRLPDVLGPHLLEQFSTFMSLLGAN